jgi:hypothetical protein
MCGNAPLAVRSASPDYGGMERNYRYRRIGFLSYTAMDTASRTLDTQ